MGLKGRKHRLKRFDKRAKAFAGDARIDRESIDLEREHRRIMVGTGRHKRLIKKQSATHLINALEQQRLIAEHLRKKKNPPEHYAFVEVKADFQEGVQEYFHKPSVGALMYFFRFKQKGRVASSLGKEDWCLCKQFLGQFKEVTLEKLKVAFKEFEKDFMDSAFEGWPNRFRLPSNTIVLGQNRDGRLRLALIDF